jgi:hypothetical protein
MKNETFTYFIIIGLSGWDSNEIDSRFPIVNAPSQVCTYEGIVLVRGRNVCIQKIDMEILE